MKSTDPLAERLAQREAEMAAGLASERVQRGLSPIIFLSTDRRGPYFVCDICGELLDKPEIETTIVWDFKWGEVHFYAVHIKKPDNSSCLEELKRRKESDGGHLATMEISTFLRALICNSGFGPRSPYRFKELDDLPF